MIRSAYALACAIALAGCSTSYDSPPSVPVVSSSGTPVVSAGAAPSASALRAGQGLIESISLATPPASASAGATAPRPSASGPYRVTVRMDDGSAQTMTIDSRAFLVGDRVQVLADGRLIRS